MRLPRLSADPPGTRKALGWSIGWTVLGLPFAGVVAALQDGQAAGEYVTGFLIEKSLSLDNLFVFAVLFSMLGVRAEDRHKVLVLGIVLAILLRAIFIVVGIAALDAFHALTYVLGALLAVTAVGVARHGGDDRDLSQSRVMGLVRRMVPANAPALTLPLVAVAAFDVMFAIDSIAAIFAVTTDTFVVFAANAWTVRHGQPLLPAGECAGPLWLPTLGPGGHPRLHRRQAHSRRRVAPAEHPQPGRRRRGARRRRPDILAPSPARRARQHQRGDARRSAIRLALAAGGNVYGRVRPPNEGISRERLFTQVDACAHRCRNRGARDPWNRGGARERWTSSCSPRRAACDRSSWRVGVST